MAIEFDETLLRIGASVLFGGALGLEREYHGHSAGLRTHLLVALASCILMLVSTQFGYYQNYDKDDLISVDPSRIASCVITGVGFLGAGAIMRTGLSVQGLTTAANLWMVSALGLASGAGMYLEAAVGTVITLFGLVMLLRLEDRPWQILRRRLAIELDDGSQGDQIIVDYLKGLGIKVSKVGYDRRLDAKKSRLYLDLQLKEQAMLDKMIAGLPSISNVRRFRVQQKN